MRINLPSLREREGRRELLIAVLDDESNGTAAFEPHALDVLDSYAWPGNLRELRNTVRVALALAEAGVVGIDHLPGQITGRPLIHVSGIGERGRLLKEIEHHRWNISAVARSLGLSRNTVYRRMHRLAITVPTEAGQADEPGSPADRAAS
jgi:transcriptional regulator of acetoin/glycerol metabolism